MFGEPQNASLHHEGGDFLLPTVAENKCTTFVSAKIRHGNLKRTCAFASTQVYAQVTEQKISNDMDKLIAKRERNRLSNEKTIGK
jgi:hypothetical protein